MVTQPLRPPPEFAHLRWHFVATDRYPEGQPLRWVYGYWADGPLIAIPPEEASTLGWRYIAPAVPLPEADDAMVEAVARAMITHLDQRAEDGRCGQMMNEMARAAIAAMRERMTDGR